MAGSARVAARRSRPKRQGYAQGSPFGREPSRPGHLSAVHAEHRAGATGDVVVRSARARDQRGRARQHPARLARILRRATRAIRASCFPGPPCNRTRPDSRVGKDNWWLWVFHHGDSAVFVAEPTRAKRVVEDFLGDFRPDYWVSDRYGGQMGWAKKENQVCLAHLIRDVQYAIDCGRRGFRPICAFCWGEPVASGDDAPRDCRRHPENLQGQARSRLDELMARRANACSRRETAKHDQANRADISSCS